MKKIVVVLLLSVMFMMSCSMQKFVNKDVKPDGTIAVIIAETQYSDIHNIFADKLSNLFEAKSRLNVIHQQKVKAVLRAYPERIKGPYKLSGDDVEVDYSFHDMDALAAIAKKIKADYLYVFWVPSVIETEIITNFYGTKKTTKDHEYYYYIGELIEFPSRRIIAQVQTELICLPGGIVLGPGGPPTSIEEMVSDFSESTVKEIVRETGIGR